MLCVYQSGTVIPSPFHTTDSWGSLAMAQNGALSHTPKLFTDLDHVEDVEFVVVIIIAMIVDLAAMMVVVVITAFATIGSLWFWPCKASL